MSMAEDAPRSHSCQLKTRHWVITDENGIERWIEGPGVVGMFPIMRPGVEFSWISSTMFATELGSMEGHFTMKKLDTGEYPVLHPGSTFSYVSCTNFSTGKGEMRGTYIFNNLATGEQISVTCPKFTMNSLKRVSRADRVSSKNCDVQP